MGNSAILLCAGPPGRRFVLPDYSRQAGRSGLSARISPSRISHRRSWELPGHPEYEFAYEGALTIGYLDGRRMWKFREQVGRTNFLFGQPPREIGSLGMAATPGIDSVRSPNCRRLLPLDQPESLAFQQWPDVEISSPCWTTYRPRSLASCSPTSRYFAARTQVSAAGRTASNAESRTLCSPDSDPQRLFLGRSIPELRTTHLAAPMPSPSRSVVPSMGWRQQWKQRPALESLNRRGLGSSSSWRSSAQGPA